MQSVAQLVKKIPPVGNSQPQGTPPSAALEAVTPINLGTLETAGRPSLVQAIDGCREWQARRARQAAEGEPVNASLVITSAPSLLPNGQPDPLRTGTGTGKTHLAMACLWTLCYVAEGHIVAPQGQFWLASQLIETLIDEKSVKRALSNAPIVVIDDVGAEGELGFIAAARQAAERQARYFGVINHCYTEGISVIITSNLAPPKLEGHLGSRCWSRLQEMAPRGQMFDLTGTPDYRRSKGAR